jgi:hypothetical protein
MNSAACECVLNRKKTDHCFFFFVLVLPVFFDCTCSQGPNVFVVPRSDQCYPDYLITFQ